MSMFNWFNWKHRRGTAPVARDRLKILLAHEGTRGTKSDLLGLLRAEIVAVICSGSRRAKYAALESRSVRMEREGARNSMLRNSGNSGIDTVPPSPLNGRSKATCTRCAGCEPIFETATNSMPFSNTKSTITSGRGSIAVHYSTRAQWQTTRAVSYEFPSLTSQ